VKELFRQDLFFRLSVITITVPPLRLRNNDVLILARHFAAKYSQEAGRTPLRFSDDALSALRHYEWPGNVRELENVIQRLVVMNDDEMVDAPDLPSLMRFSAPRHSGSHRTLAEVEGEHIKNVLAGVGGNKTRAAEILGIDRKTLREKLKPAKPS
jgi:DNA-binding NtrC family response regulator